jgi:hypothetical protein
MEKESYNFMIFTWILLLASSCGVFKPITQNTYIEHYQVSSSLLTEIVETTIDSCESRMRCNKVEYLFLQLETTTSGYSVQVESIRKPLYKLSSIFQKDSSDVISFYIGETLFLTDKEVLLSSGILNDFKISDRMDLSNLSFEYNCLDVESKEEVYNTLIRFTYSIKDEMILLEDHSIFIDSGDVDLTEVLNELGIKRQ